MRLYLASLLSSLFLVVFCLFCCVPVSCLWHHKVRCEIFHLMASYTTLKGSGFEVFKIFELGIFRLYVPHSFKSKILTLHGVHVSLICQDSRFKTYCPHLLLKSIEGYYRAKIIFISKLCLLIPKIIALLRSQTLSLPVFLSYWDNLSWDSTKTFLSPFYALSPGQGRDRLKFHDQLLATCFFP